MVIDLRCSGRFGSASQPGDFLGGCGHGAIAIMPGSVLVGRHRPRSVTLCRRRSAFAGHKRDRDTVSGTFKAGPIVGTGRTTYPIRRAMAGLMREQCLTAGALLQPIFGLPAQ